MKRLTALLLCLIMLFALTACSKDENGLRKVTLNEVTRSVFYAPLYVACSKGFFAEEGLEVDIVTGGGSDASMTALLSGEADAALMGPETGIYVTNQGKADHPMIIAQLTKRDGSFLLGREADDSFDFSKLKGKSIIAGRPGGMPYMTLLYVLRQHGLEPGKDVEVISNIQFNLMGGAFESGTGDYVTLFEPTASAFAAQGKGHIVTNMGLESGEVPYTTFMMRKDTIENEPGFAAAFVRAIYRAQKWVWGGRRRGGRLRKAVLLPGYRYRHAVCRGKELPGYRLLDQSSHNDRGRLHPASGYTRWRRRACREDRAFRACR